MIMKHLILLSVICVLGFLFNNGEPVPGAEVYIEQANNEEPVAFQQTGDAGAVTFAHLSAGIYTIYVVLPEQRGKLVRGMDKMNLDLQVGYHSEKHEYYLQEEEGCFILSFSKLKKLPDTGITPLYNQVERDRKTRFLVGKFEVTGNNGSFTLNISAFTPKNFEKKVAKARHDAAMSAIRNVR
jgi:hypothetical protein